MKQSLLLLLIFFIVNTGKAQNYKVGDKVVAQDTYNIWLPAEIIDTDPVKGYKVHYIGYTASIWDAWVGKDKVRPSGTKKEKPAYDYKQAPKDPEMNGALPKIIGTAWSILCIYNKGTQPKNNHTFYPYLFLKNGRYEVQFPRMFSMGRYTVKGNQLTQVADGSDRLTETYTLKWNAAGKYLELVGNKIVVRLQYNTTTTR